MSFFENISDNKKLLYSNDYFSGNYDHNIYLKKSNDDGSGKNKYYISIYTNINGTDVLQGYLYFYIDFVTKKVSFIGLKVEPEFRNLNIGSLLIATWIGMCFDNGYTILDLVSKQKKPFIVYMFKKYGFDIDDLSLYMTRNDVINIYKKEFDLNKYIMFHNKKHEDRFRKTNIYKEGEYEIISNDHEFEYLDSVVFPIQSVKKDTIQYKLHDIFLASEKSHNILHNHKK